MPKNITQNQSFTDRELFTGLLHAVAALAESLDQKGSLSKSEYRQTLHTLWDQMPDEDASGGAGFVFERLIDFLGPDHEES